MALQPTALADQVHRSGQDPLRVLVVGAGVAGLTAAQLLRGAGLHPIVVERADEQADQGYMLALMPMVDAALRDLNASAMYQAASIPLARYRFRSHTGRTIRTDSMATVVGRYGHYRGLSRGALVEVLTHTGCPVSFRSTVRHLRERTDAVDVTITEGDHTRQAEVDAVVIADGIASRTRDLVLTEPCTGVDTGWGGWVVWGKRPQEADLGEELWGNGFFLGLYPTPEHDGIFLGGPAAATTVGPRRFAARVDSGLIDPAPRIRDALQAVLAADHPFYWALRDVRAPRWATGRTILLGDAAAGFLPTAGIGAGMAIESAWVLASMMRTALGRRSLGRTGLASVLTEYERVQRPRVEAAQHTSRNLARLMFRTSRAAALAREFAFRLVSVEQGLRPIQRLLADPPRPAEAARRV